MHRVSSSIPAALLALVACQGTPPQATTTSSDALEAFAARAQPADSPQIARVRARLGADVLVRYRGDRPRSLFGSALGGVQLDDPLDAEEAAKAARAFFETHGDLYGLTPGQSTALEVVEVQSGDRLGLQLQQRHAGLRVVEGRFYVGFSRDGRLTRIVGGPVPQAKLPKRIEATYDGAFARRAATALSSDAEADLPELVVSEARGLGWTGTLDGPRMEATTWVDARDGSARVLRDDMGHLLKSIPVRHNRHNGGSRTDTVTRTRDINVDVDSFSFPFSTTQYCWFQLQRLGSGRARIWQGFGEGATPSFDQSTYFSQCGTDDWFNALPGATSDRQFNEQQTYYYAQNLKTYVDNWGRRANSYGHYPVDSGRDINVEIVVNGSSSRENDWCGTGVQHGCFRSRALKSWFNGHPSSSSRVPAVYLFNVGNNSYHFNGTDNSASYAIIAHEVGHFISWSYGSWDGPIASSINEGFSMTLAGLMAKDRWSSIGYGDDDEITTGGPMWDRHTNAGDLEIYDGASCGANSYELARPFVQFMWHLMNNQDESGNQVWSSNEAAIQNTADRFMAALHDLAGVSTVEWDDVASHILSRTIESINDGTEQGVLPVSFLFSNTLWRMSALINAHGLDGTCI